jgi:tetratricopeptide (TPR) repeat protein
VIQRLGGLALLALGMVTLAGCPVPPIKSAATVTSEKLPEKVPDLVKYADDIYARPNPSAEEKEYALLALDKAAKEDPKNFEAQWKAARAAQWLAAEYYDDKTKRAHFSGRGIEYAKAAIDLEPKRVEGHYYSGINLGLSATTKVVGAKFMVPSVRDALKKAMQIDACYDHGGPPAVLGSLYAEAPPWPASIGDPDKGVELLRQALKCAPDWPLNHLLLGNALVKAESYDEAKKEYEVVLAAQAKPEDEHSLPTWKTKAKKGLEDAEKKKQAALSGNS